MEVAETPKPAKAQLPQGYRQGVVTAITVFLGFSLSFMRFWGIENPGEWTWKGILSASILGTGILVELFALFRSLELRDDEPLRYGATVRWFFGGVAIVILGVFISIVVAA